MTSAVFLKIGKNKSREVENIFGQLICILKDIQADCVFENATC